MSERKRKILYALAFITFLLVVASPFAESADNMAVYIGLPLLLIGSAVAFYDWLRPQGGANDPSSKWRKRLDFFKVWPW